MKIRKQVYELTISDIEEFPVWEFASDEEGDDGQDEGNDDATSGDTRPTPRT